MTLLDKVNKKTMYRAQFDHAWQGQWDFDAKTDLRAWEVVRRYIKEHTSVVFVSIKAIYEIDADKNIIRELPACEAT